MSVRKDVTLQDISEQDVKQYVEEHGFSVDILTPDEFEEVRKELLAVKQGQFVLDGVLSNTDLLIRMLLRENLLTANSKKQKNKKGIIN